MTEEKKTIKDRVIARGMKLLENPKVQEILASKKTEKIMETGFSIASTVIDVANSAQDKTLNALGLAKQEEIEKLQRELDKINQKIEELKKAQEADAE